jgi:hypothetical protein
MSDRTIIKVLTIAVCIILAACVFYYHLCNKKIIYMNIPTSDENMVCTVDSVEQNGNVFTVTGWNFIKDKNTNPFSVTVILLNDDTKTGYGVEASYIKRTDVSQAYDMTYLYDYSGFSANITTDHIPNGEYTIVVCRRISGEDYYYISDSKVEVDR